MQRIKKYTTLIAVLCLFACKPVIGQQDVLVRNGSTTYQIVVPGKATDIEQRAADEIKNYVGRAASVNIAIVPEQIEKGANHIYIGNTKAAKALQITKGVKNDGFAIVSKGGNIYISGKEGKGTLYGANRFLEIYFGIDYLSATVISIPENNIVSVPKNSNIISNPAFITRDNFTDMGYNGKWNNNKRDYSGGYKDWHCINHVNLSWDKESNWGTFGHTFFNLVPPQTYFATHPEYYSLINGKRQAQQLNLSDPEVAGIVIQSLKKLMQDNPDKLYWMVGQEDVGKFCECADCQRAYQRYGGKQSGLMIEFINKIAKAFPDKQIATFAYNETEEPPQNIKPAANVIIVDAPISAHHNAPLNSKENSRQSNIIKQWAKLSTTLMIWDYFANFSDILSPYPNLAPMSDNFRFYRSVGAKHIFAQRPVFMPASEMEELKAYVISKLLWNPSLNQDSLVGSFARKYYGKADKFIIQYLNAINANVQKTNAVLLVQEDAQTYSNTFLTSSLIQQYNSIFDNAANAVKSDPVLSDRVNNARFAVDYFAIRMMKEKGKSSLSNISQPVLDQLRQRFKNTVKRMNIKFTGDASQKPIDPYLDVFVPGNTMSKTAIASITLFGGIGLAYVVKRKQTRKKQTA